MRRYGLILALGGICFQPCHLFAYKLDSPSLDAVGSLTGGQDPTGRITFEHDPSKIHYASLVDGTGKKKLIQYTEVTDKTIHGEVPSLKMEGKAGSKDKTLSKGLLLGGAGALGAIQGGLSGGLLGALGGAGIGVAAAWLFSRKDYGGAVGVLVGGAVGTALFPPFGGLIGAAVLGVVGHFIGKLFGKHGS